MALKQKQEKGGTRPWVSGHSEDQAVLTTCQLLTKRLLKISLSLSLLLDREPRAPLATGRNLPGQRT